MKNADELVRVIRWNEQVILVVPSSVYDRGFDWMEEVANSVPTLVDEVPQIGDLRELTMYIPESGCPYVLNQMLNRCKPVKVTLYAEGKNLLPHIVNHVDALFTHNISEVVIGHASCERGSTYTECTTCLQDEVFEFLERIRQSLEIREEIERN